MRTKRIFEIERELIVRYESNEDGKVWLDFFTKDGIKTVEFDCSPDFCKFISGITKGVTENNSIAKGEKK